MAITARKLRTKVLVANAPLDPAYPLDAETSATPTIWRANDLQWAFGLFDTPSDPSVISSVSSATLQARLGGATGSVVIHKTSSSLTQLADLAAWTGGGATVTFTLSDAETNVALGGKDRAILWISLTILTNDGKERTVAAGPVYMFETGAAAASPPPEYPGAALTLDQADGRYLKIADEISDVDVFNSLNNGWIGCNDATVITIGNDGPNDVAVLFNLPSLNGWCLPASRLSEISQILITGASDSIFAGQALQNIQYITFNSCFAGELYILCPGVLTFHECTLDFVAVNSPAVYFASGTLGVLQLDEACASIDIYSPVNTIQFLGSAHNVIEFIADQLDLAAVQYVLAQLASTGGNNGTCDLTGSAPIAPTGTDADNVAALVARGWTMTVPTTE